MDPQTWHIFWYALPWVLLLCVALNRMGAQRRDREKINFYATRRRRRQLERLRKAWEHPDSSETIVLALQLLEGVTYFRSLGWWIEAKDPDSQMHASLSIEHGKRPNLQAVVEEPKAPVPQ